MKEHEEFHDGYPNIYLGHTDKRLTYAEITMEGVRKRKFSNCWWILIGYIDFFIFKFHRTMLNQMPNSSFGGNHKMEKSLVTPTFVTRWLPTKSRKWYIHLKCMFNKRWNIVICRRSKAFYQSIKQILLYDAAKLVVFSFLVLRTNLRPPKPLLFKP